MENSEFSLYQAGNVYKVGHCNMWSEIDIFFQTQHHNSKTKQKLTFSMLIRVQKVKRSPIVFAVSLGSDTEEEAVESIR